MIQKFVLVVSMFVAESAAVSMFRDGEEEDIPVAVANEMVSITNRENNTRKKQRTRFRWYDENPLPPLLFDDTILVHLVVALLQLVDDDDENRNNTFILFVTERKR